MRRGPIGPVGALAWGRGRVCETLLSPHWIPALLRVRRSSTVAELSSPMDADDGREVLPWR